MWTRELLWRDVTWLDRLGFGSFYTRNGFLLNPQKPGAIVQVHECRPAAGLNKIGFKVIKEHRLVRPGEPLSFLFQQLPLGFDFRVLIENLFFQSIAQVHLTDNGFQTPQTPFFRQVNTFKPVIWSAENRQQFV